jgi:DNA-binding beta-propeller fold protein YncE
VVASGALAGAVMAGATLGQDESQRSTVDLSSSVTSPREARPVVLPAGGEKKVGDTAVTFDVRPLAGRPGAAKLRLVLGRDGAGSRAASPSPPLVWADRQRSPMAGSGQDGTCEGKARLFAQARLGTAPDVDFNHYDVLVLNNDATISVIDPHADVGGMTQLREMATLPSPGDDWALSPDRSRLFVSMPATDAVAVVDTSSYEMVDQLDAGPFPTQLVLDRDGDRLWVANDGGVSAIDTRSGEIVDSITTGPGQARLLLTEAAGTAHTAHGKPSVAGDARPWLFAAHADGSVVVLDPSTVEPVHRIELGAPVTDLVADRRGTVYVAHPQGLPVTVLSAGDHRAVGSLDARGVTDLAVAPDGRLGIAVSQEDDSVTVFDTATGRVLKRGGVGTAPGQISFTDHHAYIRSEGSADVAVLELARLRSPGPLGEVSVTVGDKAPAEVPVQATADAMAPVHGTEVLVANSADRYVYMYMPGMNAAMGGFQTYGRSPRAVTVVDQGLVESASGTFEADFTAREPGTYDLAVLLDSTTVQCFTFRVKAGDGGASAVGVPNTLEVVEAPARLEGGTPAEVLLRITDEDGSPVTGLSDVQALALHESGSADARATALPDDEGLYRLELTPPLPGPYEVLLAVPSQGLSLGELPSFDIGAPGASSGRTVQIEPRHDEDRGHEH